MKRFSGSAAGLPALLLAAALLPGCGPLTGPPGNLEIGAATDTTVQLAWTAPAEGPADSYVVLFRSLGESAFTQVAETSATNADHNPHGMTGDYQVAAKFGEELFPSGTILTTIPVHESTKVVSELDGTGNAAYGWNRDSGLARTYSMKNVSNVAYADFYVTDFASGSGRLPYAIASPSMGPSDPAHLVPTGNWRSTWITETLPPGDAPLPHVDLTTYFNYTLIPTVPVRLGWYSLSDEYFGLVKVTRVDAGAAVAELETWFQLVKGLRLIAHE